MKLLWERIIESKANIVRGQTDPVVSFLIAQIEESFQEEVDPMTGGTVVNVNHRYCRYALNTLMELFKLPDLICELSVGTLASVSELLLCRLMDDRLKAATADTQSKQLMQAINVLVLKVMENSDRTAILHVLIGFLQRAQAQPLGPNPPLTCSPAFVELVVRCLSKLIRTFQASGMLLIDMERLLQDIHAYLNMPQVQQAMATAAQLGPEAPASPDQSSRAVRSILALMVQVKGEALLSDITATLPPDTPVYPIVDKAVSNWRAKNGQTFMQGTQQFTPGHRATLRFTEVPTPQSTRGGGAVVDRTSAYRTAPAAFSQAPRSASLLRSEGDLAQTQSGSVGGDRWRVGSGVSAQPSLSSSVTSTPSAAVVSPVTELPSLVSAVLTPATTRAGLTALAAFARNHPQVDVMAAFSGQSESFRSYVQRNIAMGSGLEKQRPQSAGPVRPSEASASALPSSAASGHQRVGSSSSALTSSSQLSSTDALRERLAALQSKAKAVTGTAAVGSVAEASSAFPSPITPVLPPTPTPTSAPVAAPLPPSALTRPSTGLPSTSIPTSGGTPSRSSLNSQQSMDAIKQRFAALHHSTQRLSGQSQPPATLR